MSDSHNRSHEIISEIKRIAIKLGKIPTQSEFKVNSKIPYSALELAFGTYSIAINASGLKPEKSKKNKKAASAIYDNFITRKVEDLTARAFEPKFPIFGPYPKIVAIGDIHAPWLCEITMMLIYEFIERVKPEFIVVMGDEYDFFAQSKFPKQILISPEDEVKTARAQLEKVFQSLKRVAPKTKIYNLLGNHNLRPVKRLIESAPELMPFFDFDSYFKFPESEFVNDPREPLIIGGIAFHHGFMKQYSHMVKFQKPTVCAHTHNGGLLYQKVQGKWLWELNAGYAGNPSKPCFNYTPVREPNWTRGVGYISEWGPHWLPFE